MAITGLNINLLKKIAKIQMKMDIKKLSKNDYAGFKYRNLDAILNELKPSLQENQLMCLFQDLKFDEEKVYITLNIIDLENEVNNEYKGEIKIDWDKSKMDKTQKVLSALTFLKKSLLENLFFINESDDPDSFDNTNNNKKTVQNYNKIPQPTPPTPPQKPYQQSQTKDYKITDKQRKMLFAILHKKIEKENQKQYLLDTFNITSTENLLKSEFDNILKIINDLPDLK